MAWDNFFTNAVPGRYHIKQVRWLSSKCHCIAVLLNGNSNFKASDIEWSSFLISVVQLENLFCLLAAEYANFHEINFAPNFPSPASKLILRYAASHYRLPMLSWDSWFFMPISLRWSFLNCHIHFRVWGSFFGGKRTVRNITITLKVSLALLWAWKEVVATVICVCLYFYKVCPIDYFASSSP